MRIHRLLLLAALWAGCGGPVDPQGGGENVTSLPADLAAARVSFARDIAPLLSEHCANGYCHPGNYSPMSLRPSDALANLVGARSTCSDGRPRVAPGDASPQGSYLMAKLLGEALCGGSDPMPPGRRRLPAETVAVFRDWIAGGAHE